MARRKSALAKALWRATRANPSASLAPAGEGPRPVARHYCERGEGMPFLFPRVVGFVDAASGPGGGGSGGGRSSAIHGALTPPARAVLPELLRHPRPDRRRLCRVLAPHVASPRARTRAKPRRAPPNIVTPAKAGAQRLPLRFRAS